MKTYDVIIDNQFGIILGKRILIFIKTGRGGTIEGHENKYLNMCRLLSEQYGYSFVVSANPEASSCDLEEEIRQVSEYIKNYDEIYFVGISNGASVGARQCWRIDKIKNALLINGPLMINWLNIKDGAKRFKGEQMIFVYGTQDPSFPYIELLSTIKNDACRYKALEGEGHRLSVSTLEFELRRFLNERI